MSRGAGSHAAARVSAANQVSHFLRTKLPLDLFEGSRWARMVTHADALVRAERIEPANPPALAQRVAAKERSFLGLD